MKNQECLIAELRDKIDDGGSALEAVVNYNIACPYNNGIHGHEAGAGRYDCSYCF